MPHRPGIASAPALVVTMDSPVAFESVVSAARAERPDLIIVARTRKAEHAAKLCGLNVTDAVPETIDASLQLSEALLVNIGVPTGLVITSIHEKRDEFRRALQGPEREGRGGGRSARPLGQRAMAEPSEQENRVRGNATKR